MELILGLLLIVFLIASIVLPWILKGRINELDARVSSLQVRLDALDPGHMVTQPAAQPASIPAQAVFDTPGMDEPVAISTTVPPTQPAPARANPWQNEAAQVEDFDIITDETPEQATERKTRNAFNFEQQVGARLPVWIGGIALALAGFFFVKYSIEAGLLSPAVRTVLGIVFGTGLMAAGVLFRAKSNVANNGRIGQALLGAGLADLYVCIFAATNLYYLVTPALGFVGMAMVTALAVFMSLRHGAPIAALGLIGGFLTPVLIQTDDPNVPMLFLYLYAVIAGLLVAIRKQQWWELALPTVLGAFLWAGIFIVSAENATDNFWLALFVAAVAATVVAVSRKAVEDDQPKAGELFPVGMPSILNYLSLAGTVILSGYAISNSTLGALEWGLFGLLSVAGLVLAALNERVYSFVPWLGAGVAVFVLSGWNFAEPAYLAVATLGFGALYGIGGYLLMWRTTRPVSLAGVAVASVYAFFTVAYLRVDWLVNNLLYTPMYNPPAVPEGPWPVWALLGAALAAIGALCTAHVHERFKGAEETRQRLMALFILGASALLTTGLAIELSDNFFALALAAQMLAMAVLALKFDIRALRSGAAIMGTLCGLTLLPDAHHVLTHSHTMHDLEGDAGQVAVLALSALAYGATAYALRLKRDARIVRWFEGGAAVVGGFTLLGITRHLQGWTDPDFTQLGIIGFVLFGYAVSVLHAGRRFARSALVDCGQFFVIALTFMTYLLGLLVENPLFVKQDLGTTYILNPLMLAYALPAIWTGIAMHDLKGADRKGWLGFLGGSAFIFLFTYVTFAVRHYFQGADIQSYHATSNAEIYTYSVAWLAMGAGLLAAGMVTARRYMRLAGLALVTFTVAKVFLYDASELTGLYRVVSFLGLGLSLLGLSWFYTRFIHGAKK